MKNFRSQRFLFLIILGTLFFLLNGERTYGQLVQASQVVINELGVAPGSPFCTCDAAGGGEFIELYNQCTVAVDISCYIIIHVSESGGGNPTGFTVTIPNGTTLNSGAFYLIGGAGQQFPPGPPAEWGAPTNGAITAYNNPGGGVCNLDVSVESGVECSSLNSLQVGNLVDKKGVVILADPTGTIWYSVVTWNIASFTAGTSSADFPALSVAGAGCTAPASIAFISDGANEVTGTYGIAAADFHNISLQSNGTYLGSTSEGTPGVANTSQLANTLVCVLPVTWISWSAQEQDNAVNVKWETASETNCAYFEVQLMDGTNDAKPLARVPGHGNSSELLAYSTLVNKADLNPWPQTNYFRIKEVDNNGNFNYCSIFTQVPGDGLDFQINPTLNYVGYPLTIGLNHPTTGAPAQLEVIAEDGKTMYNHSFSDGEKAITYTPGYSGIYLVRLSYGEHRIVKKIIVR